MRTFVALEVPDPQVIDSLVEAQKQLLETGTDLKLVERENLHFTVRFLGEITQAQVIEADGRLKRAPPDSVQVELRGVGAFPSAGKARVVWAGVAVSDEALVAPIADYVSSALEGIGERDERPFKAHITLARVRSARNASALSAVISGMSRRTFGRVTLRTLKLKSSQLTPSGPVYDDLGVYPLR